MRKLSELLIICSKENLYFDATKTYRGMCIAASALCSRGEISDDECTYIQDECENLVDRFDSAEAYLVTVLLNKFNLDKDNIHNTVQLIYGAWIDHLIKQGN